MSLSLTGHKRMFCFTVCVLRRQNLHCSMYRSAEFRLECAAFHRQLCRLNICETFSGKTKKNQTNTAVICTFEIKIYWAQLMNELCFCMHGLINQSPKVNEEQKQQMIMPL